MLTELIEPSLIQIINNNGHVKKKKKKKKLIVNSFTRPNENNGGHQRLEITTDGLDDC